MAKTAKAASNAVSLSPDDMLAGGLKDDFRGKISEAAWCAWDYDGAIDEPALAVKLTLEVEDEEEPYVQHYSAGNLDDFRPSEDGKEPVEDNDGEGPFCVRVGKKAQLNNNTNFAQFMTAALDAGKAAKVFGPDDLTPSLECLIGLDAHWNRVPQKKRAGMVDRDEEQDGKKKRTRDILLPTTVYAYGDETAKGGSGKQAAKASTKKAKEEPEEEAADAEVSPLDAKLNEAIVGILEANKGKITKKKLGPEVLKALAKDKDKAKAIKRVQEDEFLSAGGEDGVAWTYDEDSGVLEAVEE